MLDRDQPNRKSMDDIILQLFKPLRVDIGQEALEREIENHYQLMPFNDAPIFRYKNQLYHSFTGLHSVNSSIGVSLRAKYVDKLDLSVYRKEARQILRTVVDGPLSTGDKLIINHVASRTFDKMVQQTLDPEDPLNYNIRECACPHINQAALYELETYGFKINSPKFKNLNLRSRDGD